MMLKKKEIVLVMMMVIMILGAQVQAQSNDIEAHHHKKHRHCASKCALKCLFNFRLTPVTYMTCFSLCCLKCKIFPPDSVYSCTSACAHSKALTLCNNGNLICVLQQYFQIIYFQVPFNLCLDYLIFGFI